MNTTRHCEGGLKCNESPTVAIPELDVAIEGIASSSFAHAIAIPRNDVFNED